MTRQSIYVVTRAKLELHGAGRNATSRTILQDKKLFLLFVKLERATQTQDIELIQKSIEYIAIYLNSINKYYLIIFAYMYLYFSDYSTINPLPEPLDNGWTRYKTDHSRQLSDEERTIHDWAGHMFHRYSNHFYRALREAEARRRLPV